MKQIDRQMRTPRRPMKMEKYVTKSAKAAFLTKPGTPTLAGLMEGCIGAVVFLKSPNHVKIQPPSIRGLLRGNAEF